MTLLANTACALLAPECVSCGHPLTQVTTGPVCPTCWDACTFQGMPQCAGCGSVLPTARPALPQRCSGCRETPSPISRLMAFAAHDGVLRTLIHEAKYGGHASIATDLGRRMRPCVADLLVGADGIVPVPLHPLRRLQRGFNQAELLALAMGVPVIRVLRRRRWTPPQAQLTAGRRRTNVAQAFALAWRPWRPVATAVRDQVLVLVDDVRTTGATLDACATVLREAGAAEVRALVVARAERTHSPGRGRR